jgi:hypothetical protein
VYNILYQAVWHNVLDNCTKTVIELETMA